MIFLQFCLGDPSQIEDAVSTSILILCERDSKSEKFLADFDEIKCFKLKTNQQIIAPLKYQIPSGRSPSLWNEILWKLGEFDIPFESSGVRESCAFLPHGITNEHSNIDSHQDTDNMNQTTARHITTDFSQFDIYCDGASSTEVEKCLNLYGLTLDLKGARYL